MAKKRVEIQEEPKAVQPNILERQTISLMQEAYRLKMVMNEKVGDSEYDPEIHLARRYKECKTELATIVAEEKVKVEQVKDKPSKFIRLGGFKFTSRLQEGRKTLDQDKLRNLLLAEGMHIGVITKLFEESTKQGPPFWVNEIEQDKE